MSTAYEHRDTAEKLLAQAVSLAGAKGLTVDQLIAAAHVHAVLAGTPTRPAGNGQGGKVPS